MSTARRWLKIRRCCPSQPEHHKNNRKRPKGKRIALHGHYIYLGYHLASGTQDSTLWKTQFNLLHFTSLSLSSGKCEPVGLVPWTWIICLIDDLLNCSSWYIFIGRRSSLRLAVLYMINRFDIVPNSSSRLLRRRFHYWGLAEIWK